MILRVDLTLHRYKIDWISWRTKAKRWVSSKFYDFGQTIFSDEDHVHLNGYVNKQNCRIWSEENIHEYVKSYTLECDIHARGIIGPYFF